jgi:alkylhydroperoxidase family enzyme
MLFSRQGYAAALGRAVCVLLIVAPGGTRAESKPRLPALPNDAAWAKLPDAPPTAKPLPIWARALAARLPITTARMLELDAMHRGGDRLDARLRGLARWAAADANRSEYGKALAAADLRRAGVTTDPRELTKGGLPAIDRAVIAFSRKMMREAHAVTDDEFKHLLELAGEERVVALVALLAHASFQDRIFLALNAAPEAGGPPPPVTATFGRPKPKTSGPPPAAKIDLKTVPGTTPADWRKLQQELETQRGRAGRIRVPSTDEVLRRLGKGHPAAWQSGILWSRVCYGYQPELTDAWFASAAAFRQETAWDPVFSQSIFWVVTRSLKCFY